MGKRRDKHQKGQRRTVVDLDDSRRYDYISNYGYDGDDGHYNLDGEIMADEVLAERSWHRRDNRNRASRERDVRDRDMRDRDIRDMSRRDRNIGDWNNRDRHIRDRDIRDRDLRDREIRDRDGRDRDRHVRDRDIGDRNIRDRHSRDRDIRDRHGQDTVDREEEVFEYGHTSSEPLREEREDVVDTEVVNFLAEIEAISIPDESNVAMATGSAVADVTSVESSVPDHAVSRTEDKPDPQTVMTLTEPATMWQQCLDATTQCPYYWNRQSNEVTWQIPPEFTAYLLLYQHFTEKVERLTREGVKFNIVPAEFPQTKVGDTSQKSSRSKGKKQKSEKRNKHKLKKDKVTENSTGLDKVTESSKDEPIATTSLQLLQVGYNASDSEGDDNPVDSAAPREEPETKPIATVGGECDEDDDDAELDIDDIDLALDLALAKKTKKRSKTEDSAKASGADIPMPDATPTCKSPSILDIPLPKNPVSLPPFEIPLPTKPPHPLLANTCEIPLPDTSSLPDSIDDIPLPTVSGDTQPTVSYPYNDANTDAGCRSDGMETTDQDALEVTHSDVIVIQSTKKSCNQHPEKSPSISEIESDPNFIISGNSNFSSNSKPDTKSSEVCPSMGSGTNESASGVVANSEDLGSVGETDNELQACVASGNETCSNKVSPPNTMHASPNTDVCVSKPDADSTAVVDDAMEKSSETKDILATPCVGATGSGLLPLAEPSTDVFVTSIDSPVSAREADSKPTTLVSTEPKLPCSVSINQKLTVDLMPSEFPPSDNGHSSFDQAPLISIQQKTQNIPKEDVNVSSEPSQDSLPLSCIVDFQVEPSKNASMPPSQDASLQHSERTQLSPTEDPTEDVPSRQASPLSSTKDVALPSMEDVSLPSTADVSLPSTEDVSLPSTEDVSLPSTEDVSLPSTEDVSLPSTEDVSLQPVADVPLLLSKDTPIPSHPEVTQMPPTKDPTDVQLPPGEDVQLPPGEDVQLPTTQDGDLPSMEDASLPPTEVVLFPHAEDIQFPPIEKAPLLPMQEACVAHEESTRSPHNDSSLRTEVSIGPASPSQLPALEREADVYSKQHGSFDRECEVHLTPPDLEMEVATFMGEIETMTFMREQAMKSSHVNREETLVEGEVGDSLKPSVDETDKSEEKGEEIVAEATTTDELQIQVKREKRKRRIDGSKSESNRKKKRSKEVNVKRKDGENTSVHEVDSYVVETESACGIDDILNDIYYGTEAATKKVCQDSEAEPLVGANSSDVGAVGPKLEDDTVTSAGSEGMDKNTVTAVVKESKHLSKRARIRRLKKDKEENVDGCDSDLVGTNGAGVSNDSEVEYGRKIGESLEEGVVKEVDGEGFIGPLMERVYESETGVACMDSSENANDEMLIEGDGVDVRGKEIGEEEEGKVDHGEDGNGKGKLEDGSEDTKEKTQKVEPANSEYYYNEYPVMSTEEMNKVFDEINDLSTMLLDKLSFLEVGKVGLSSLQTLLISIETRLEDWQHGGIDTLYFLAKLTDASSQLSQYEALAAPPGWTCLWSRTDRRYFYANDTSGETQWDYPDEKVTVGKTSVKSTPISTSEAAQDSGQSNDPSKCEAQYEGRECETQDDKMRDKKTTTSTPPSTQVVHSQYADAAPMEVYPGQPVPPGIDFTYPACLLVPPPPPPPPPEDDASNPVEETEEEFDDSALTADPVLFSYYRHHGVKTRSSDTSGSSLSSMDIDGKVTLGPLPADIPLLTSQDASIDGIEIQTTDFTPHEQGKSSGLKEKKKKRDKLQISGSALSLKKKNVTSLVKKWKQIKEEVEREDGIDAMDVDF